MEEPVRLVTSRGDREVADEFRRRLEEVLRPVLEIWEEANRAQFQTGFRFERDSFGKGRIVVTLFKEF